MSPNCRELGEQSTLLEAGNALITQHSHRPLQPPKPLSPSGHGRRSMSWSWVPSFFPVASCTAKLRHPQASKESGKLFTATWQVTNGLGHSAWPGQDIRATADTHQEVQ